MSDSYSVSVSSFEESGGKKRRRKAAFNTTLQAWLVSCGRKTPSLPGTQQRRVFLVAIPDTTLFFVVHLRLLVVPLISLIFID